jgi:hypothetical protein
MAYRRRKWRNNGGVSMAKKWRGESEIIMWRNLAAWLKI